MVWNVEDRSYAGYFHQKNCPNDPSSACNQTRGRILWFGFALFLNKNRSARLLRARSNQLESGVILASEAHIRSYLMGIFRIAGTAFTTAVTLVCGTMFDSA
jgi:hypothetical protein